MKISKKLIIGFSVVICLSVIVGAFGIIGMQRLLESGISMYDKQVIGMEYLAKAAAAFKDARIENRQAAISCFYDDLKGAEDAKQRFELSMSEFEFLMTNFRNDTPAEELIRFHNKIMMLFHDEYIPKANKIIEMCIADVPDHVYKLEINVKMAAVVEITERIENLITGMLDLESAIAKQTNKDNFHLTRLFIYTQYILLFAAITVAVIVAAFVTGNISRPVKETARILDEVAKGNLSARVTGDYKGEFATIKDSVNTMAVGISSYIDDKILAEREAHESNLAKGRAEAVSEAMISSIEYASKIQCNLLPKNAAFEKAFADYSIIWNPKDIVGGDIYWIKNFEEGSVLCVCDCTGHGTPGALLTMLVVSAFEDTINENNCKDTAQIVWSLEQRLVNVFNVSDNADRKSKAVEVQDGCDLAVLFIAKDKSVFVSAGHTNIFVSDGKEVKQIKGQKIYVGEGKLKSKDDISIVFIPSNPDNKFYVASDGLYDQIGGTPPRPFGYRLIKQLILEAHNEKQAIISDRIWTAFENHRGRQIRRDDVQLITFKP